MAQQRSIKTYSECAEKRQRLEACTILERQQTDELERREALTAEGSVYDELRTAFSVRGVPEIEIEAHRLLARWVGAQLQVLVINKGFGTQDVQGWGHRFSSFDVSRMRHKDCFEIVTLVPVAPACE